MPHVQTVRGPVDTAELGQTLMHEHVFVLTADVQQNYPEEWGSEDAAGRRRRREAQRAARPRACGRSSTRPSSASAATSRASSAIAEQVDLNIVVATGCYTYDDVPFFFHHRGPALNAALGTEVPDPMVDMFVRDITEGIAGTGVRAAFLKCAIDRPGLTAGVERVMRAVAKAHRRTGVPITVHTHPGTQTGPRWSSRCSAEEGVDPRRVVLGHSGDTTDADHLCELADAGFVLGHGPVRHQPRDDVRGARRHRRGDVPAGLRRADGAVAGRRPATSTGSTRTSWRFLPQWHYLHIHEEVLPYLREHGVTEEQIDTMLVGQPAPLLRARRNRVTEPSRRRADRSRRDAGVRGSADRGDLAGAGGRQRRPRVGVGPAGVDDPRAGRRGGVRRGGPVSGRALRLTMRASRTSSPDEDTADDQKRREHVQNVSGGPFRVTGHERAKLPEDRPPGCHTSLIDGGAVATCRTRAIVTVGAGTR